MKRFAVILLSAALMVSSLSGCGGADKRTGKSMAGELENENAVRGEVSKVTEDSITIKVKQGKGTQEESTGEEQEIAITKDTVIKRQNFGGGMPGAGQMMPEDMENGEWRNAGETGWRNARETGWRNAGETGRGAADRGKA